jgi:hypothetical protein
LKKWRYKSHGVISVTPWFVAAGAKAQMQKAYGEGEEYFT